MKSIKLLFLTIVAMTAFSSCGDDDEFYNSKYVAIPELIQVERQNVYLVGEAIYVNTDFSKILNEPGFSTPLDIYKTTNGASFSFSFGLEKRNPDNTWSIVDLENKMIGDRGNIFDGSYNIAECIYNPATETYQFRAGIPLQETGTYRIFFGFSDASRLELASNNDSEKSTYLNIKTTIKDLNDLYYNFTVN